MKLWIVAAIALVAVAVQWMDRSHYTVPTSAVPLNVQPYDGAAQLPQLCVETMQMQGGAPYCLSDAAGRYLLINFWASWCAPCVHEFPILLELAEKYPERLTLVLFSADSREQDAEAFIMELTEGKLLPDNVVSVWDKDRAIALRTFQTMRYPESIFVAPDGRMLQKIVGVVDDAALAGIERVLAGR